MPLYLSYIFRTYNKFKFINLILATKRKAFQSSSAKIKCINYLSLIFLLNLKGVIYLYELILQERK